MRRWFEEVPAEWRSLLSLLREQEGEVQGSQSFVSAVELAHHHGVVETSEAVQQAVRSGIPSVALIRYHLGVAESCAAPKLVYPGPRVEYGSVSDYKGVTRG